MDGELLALRQALSDWTDGRTGPDPSALARRLLAAATAALARPASRGPATSDWHRYLDLTGDPAFLRSLPDRAVREAWAETAFGAIRASNYSLRTMLEQRVRSHGDRVFLEDRREREAPCWSFGEVARYARAIAGLFLGLEREPRVAILCDNNVDGAIADLACLTEGILVTPLNVHLDQETLGWILERLDINVVLTDTDEREARVDAACAETGRRVRVFRTGARAGSLRQECARVDLAEAEARLEGRRPDIHAATTVMFTSGSTGQVKGVAFSPYMLVAKRFARAAALPEVGDDEVLLSYLPLFHTFGRYLELLGMLYWRGRYVFAGNPSADSLIAQLGRVQPTGLISVPVRWTQIREQSLEAMRGSSGAGVEDMVFRQVVGERLRWGLSAAGYLDPQVFRFFHRHGVELCSGFGMTEATGGITMTPPGRYVEGTVGLPLPGIATRLSEAGELEIAGEYVAVYLDNAGPPGSLPDLDPDAERWIATGDVFRRHANGFYEIVDRIKDIYKNSRGQTVAPQRVEQRFVNVPGIRRTFLAGDHRDHNVLLIVPDPDRPVLSRRSPDEAREYFARIVASANASLAPYERVVDFAVLDRDFDVERGELTPKGSYRRKVIATNLAPVIEGLYRSNHVELGVGPYRVRIPRWFFRDLGVLEGDIIPRPGGLRNRRTGQALRLAAGQAGRVRVGDLEYRIDGDLVDLGLFARQPRLWLGNPRLVAFAPCKPGWDVALAGVSEQVRLPRGARGRTRPAPRPASPIPGSDRLGEIHELATTALFAPSAEARQAVERLGVELGRGGPRIGSTIRRRLEALAFRPEEEVRALAYRTLLLDVPLIDYDKVFPAFIESGRSYLTEESIAAIAAARRGERRLQGLRQRLHSYRARLEWPTTPARRRQFYRLFRLLANFARADRDHYAAVQSEFAAWALFPLDPHMARAARRHFDDLTRWHEARLRTELPEGRAQGARPAGKVVFEFGIDPAERARIEEILFDPTFLRHSINRAFNEDGFTWDAVEANGVWVSPTSAHRQLRLYRLGINMVDGRHFDLLLVTGGPLRHRGVTDTILWMASLSGHAFGTPALPRFGAWRKDLGAVTVVYVSDLTAWERIREMASRRDVHDATATRDALRKLYVRAMATFFRAWEHSGYRIVPGAVTPHNVALPDADFQEGTAILSLAGWRPYDGPLSLVRPMVRTFYRLTAAHYPQTREALRLSWLLDAAMEALGSDAAIPFLGDLERELDGTGGSPELEGLLAELDAYRAALAAGRHVPLPVLSAIDRYGHWERMNPAASPEAREETVVQMLQVYRFDRFDDALRYHLYRHTYFRHADPAIAAAFDRITRRRLPETDGTTDEARRLEDLSALQGLLGDPADRAVFSRMVFPHAQRTQKLELFALDGDGERVGVRSRITDDTGTAFTVREPVSPAEVGHLYHLILETSYPIRIAENDRHLVIVDDEDRTVGGLTYRWEEGDTVYVDGIVVARSLTNRGLGGALLEDFCVRTAAQGARLAKTNFFLGGLFSRHGFQVSRQWGGLVRALS
jgi:long-chain acyl-CoA synthetase